MREYTNQNELWIEPFRADSFPVIKDVLTNRDAFDRIIQAGGYVSTNTGSAPDANSQLIRKPDADAAFDAATCIGCGACVAVCPNASASLFVSAKIAHLDHLPQGRVQSDTRATNMARQMELEGFGSCSNHRHCESVCPQDISISNITTMNRLL
jgi:succinate dehydrogenase / fumarate reductase iron-sulfur subunit